MERPEDLFPLKEAAVVVGRSPSTLRAWIRAGELQGYREVLNDPNSRVLVSRQALLMLAARSKPIHPGGPRPEATESPGSTGEKADVLPTPTHEKAEDRRSEERRIEERLLLAALSAERDGLRAVIEAQKLTISTLEARCRDLENSGHSERLRAQEYQDRLVAAEAELGVLRGWQRLPWYRRLLASPAGLPG
jgi:hypothetical protein